MRKKVSILLLAFTLLLVLAAFSGQTVATANDIPQFVPFKVQCQTYPMIMGVEDGFLVLEIPSDCRGNRLGRGEWYADSLVDIANPPPLLQTGDMVFTAANGDQLIGDFFGYAMPRKTSGNYYWGGYEINSGTGQFEGVTGSGLYHGQADGEVGTLVFEGTLTLP